MPMTPDYTQRLTPLVQRIADHYATPFHIYDEQGIRGTCQQLKSLFSGIDGFMEYFAVKALPNPEILKIFMDEGFGFDCSSSAELSLARMIGAKGEALMFTSNNTSPEEFQAASADGGSILNLDDITLIPKVEEMPELICFRYNPGNRRTGNEIIGTPLESKYGVSHDQLVDAYRGAMDRGAKRFGLHTMLASNELNHTYMVETAAMLLDRIKELQGTLGITFEFINIGGGLGIPYQPGQPDLDIAAMAREITALFQAFKKEMGYMPKLCMESGRFMAGPHGVLATRVINKKETYRNYVGVDASMAALMRPGMYGAYHHITVPGKEAMACDTVVDVVGSLCENNDKFAIQRPLPALDEGDLLLIHDTGAHGHAMGFNYNGQMRPKELLLASDGTVRMIRREETFADYTATLTFEDKGFNPM